MSGTIRSRMEAQRDRHTRTVKTYTPAPREWCAFCQHTAPCPDRVAADDTLTDLNNLQHVWRRSHGSMLQTDPMMGYPERAEHFRLIPDPDSRGAT